jgi:hypothetical protein
VAKLIHANLIVSVSIKAVMYEISAITLEKKNHKKISSINDDWTILCDPYSPLSINYNLTRYSVVTVEFSYDVRILRIIMLARAW